MGQRWKWTLETKAEKELPLSHFHTFSQEIKYIHRNFTLAA